MSINLSGGTPNYKLLSEHKLNQANPQFATKSFATGVSRASNIHQLQGLTTVKFGKEHDHDHKAEKKEKNSLMNWGAMGTGAAGLLFAALIAAGTFGFGLPVAAIVGLLSAGIAAWGAYQQFGGGGEASTEETHNHDDAAGNSGNVGSTPPPNVDNSTKTAVNKPTNEPKTKVDHSGSILTESVSESELERMLTTGDASATPPTAAVDSALRKAFDPKDQKDDYDAVKGWFQDFVKALHSNEIVQTKSGAEDAAKIAKRVAHLVEAVVNAKPATTKLEDVGVKIGPLLVAFDIAEEKPLGSGTYELKERKKGEAFITFLNTEAKGGDNVEHKRGKITNPTDDIPVGVIARFVLQKWPEHYLGEQVKSNDDYMHTAARLSEVVLAGQDRNLTTTEKEAHRTEVLRLANLVKAAGIKLEANDKGEYTPGLNILLAPTKAIEGIAAGLSGKEPYEVQSFGGEGVTLQPIAVVLKQLYDRNFGNIRNKVNGTTTTHGQLVEKINAITNALASGTVPDPAHLAGRTRANKPVVKLDNVAEAGITFNNMREAYLKLIEFIGTP